MYELMIVTSCPRFFVRKRPKGGLSWKSSRCSRLLFLENPRKVDGLLGNLGKWMKVMMKIDEKSLENLTYCNLFSKIQMILVFFSCFFPSMYQFCDLQYWRWENVGKCWNYSF